MRAATRPTHLHGKFAILVFWILHACSGGSEVSADSGTPPERSLPMYTAKLLDECDPLKVGSRCIDQRTIASCRLEAGKYVLVKDTGSFGEPCGQQRFQWGEYHTVCDEGVSGGLVVADCTCVRHGETFCEDGPRPTRILSCVPDAETGLHKIERIEACRIPERNIFNHCAQEQEQGTDRCFETTDGRGPICSCSLHSLVDVCEGEATERYRCLPVSGQEIVTGDEEGEWVKLGIRTECRLHAPAGRCFECSCY